MYVSPNYPTARALKDAIRAGVPVRYYQPGMGETPLDGVIWVEGPHYPAPHTWYAECQVVGGKIVRVK